MKKLHKILIIPLTLTAVLALSGCSKLDSYIQHKVTESAEAIIHDSQEYQKYEEYQSAGMLGEDGLFPATVPNEPADDIDNPKTIKVSFATNAFLNCVYFTDEEMKAPIISTETRLSPGDTIYIANVSVDNDISNLYDFHCFRIWSYDLEGRRSTTPYNEVSDRGGVLLRIPEDYQGTGFSIEPLGIYSNRHITAKAYYYNDGQEKNLPNGHWEINSKPFEKDNGTNPVADISPVDSYTIIYSYDVYKDDYYFVKSQPDCWYSKESNHTVIFREASSNEQNTEFSVEMHPYITLEIENKCLSWAANLPVIGDQGKGILQSITLGSESIGQDHVSEKSFSIQKLRVGDIISIRVGKEYAISGVGVNVGTAVPLGSNAENGYEYTIIVPDTNKGIRIEISERNSDAEGRFAGYTLANADVIIARANNTVLRIGDELPGDDEKVTLAIIPHDGYYIEGFNEKNDYSFVKKNYEYSRLESEILSTLNSHPAVHFITLHFEFTDEYGDITYKLDGKEVTSSTLTEVRVGQTLKADYTAKSGYEITHDWFGGDAFYDMWTLIGGSDSIIRTISVTPDLDKTTINRVTFGIIVEKVG